MVVYSYDLVARPDAAGALRNALADLIAALEGAVGHQGSEMLRSLDNECRINFRERWDSVQAHDEAGHLLPGAIMAAMMAALSEKPGRAIYEVL